MTFPRFVFNILPDINVEIHFLIRGGDGFVNQLIEFNIEKTNKSSLFQKSIIGPASVTIEKFVREIIEN